MVTYIGRSNIKAFAPLLPEYAESPKRLAFGCIDDGVACGALVLSVNGSHAAVEHIYVAKEYRLRGHGSTLLERALSFASEKSLSETVFCYDPDEHEGIDILLLKNGCYRISDEISTLNVTLGELMGSADFAKRIKHGAESAVPISAVPTGWVHSFCGQENFFFDPIDLQSIDTDISAVVTGAKGIAAAAWVSGDGDGLTIDGIFFSSAGSGTGNIVPILAAMLHAAEAKYPSSTPVSFAIVAPAMEAITKKLFPDVSFSRGRIVSEGIASY